MNKVAPQKSFFRRRFFRRNIWIRKIVQVLSSFISPRYHFLGIYVAADIVGGEVLAGDDLEAVAWYPLCGPLPPMGFEEDADVIELYATGSVKGLPVDERHGAA